MAPRMGDEFALPEFIAPPPSSRRRRGLFCIAVVLFVILAAVVRIVGARGDLWLDEVWTFQHIAPATSPWDIVTFVNHDNSHFLNTLYFYYLGSGQPAFVYRLLSLATGVGAVVMAGIIGRRYGVWDAGLAMLLVGLSYPMIHYASEARGYSSAAFFALVGFDLLQRQSRVYSRATSVAFAIVSVLGVLSHMTFVLVYAGLAAWSLLIVTRTRTPRPMRELFVMHAFPLLTIADMYFLSVHDGLVGGGPSITYGMLIRLAIADGLGIPSHPVLVVGIAVVLGLAIAKLLVSSSRGNAEWVFFVMACVGAPTLVLMAADRVVYPRYFFVTLPFWLLLLARVLAKGMQASRATRFLAFVALLGFVIGNTVQAWDFLVYGRGEYRAALAYCVEHSPCGVPVTVGGDHSFRIGTLVSYHSANNHELHNVKFLEWTSSTADDPVWLIKHDFEEVPSPRSKVLAPNQATYRLSATFRFSGLSGMNLYVYRSSNAETP